VPIVQAGRPDLAPQKEEKLMFGQLLQLENVTPETFGKISEFKGWFQDETVKLDNAN
jgi:hypothetical protein